MFTGIVESLGRVESLKKGKESLTLEVNISSLNEASAVCIGDSISLNGCCLTVKSIQENCVQFDVMEETFNLTTLSSLSVGSFVNMENALRPTGRLGGHYVSGHIDGIAEIQSIVPGDRCTVFNFKGQGSYTDDMILRGSVALDGVSLTLTKLDQKSKEFAVSIIDHTLDVTKFKGYRIGDRVNVETDMIGKFVKGHVERILSSRE